MSLRPRSRSQGQYVRLVRGGPFHALPCNRVSSICRRCIHFIALPMATIGSQGCSMSAPRTADSIVVPLEVPIGTKVNVAKDAVMPNRYVLVMVSDCESCSADVLKLSSLPREMPKVVLTIHPELKKRLAAQWKGCAVKSDPEMKLLPSFCYRVTPQLILVNHGLVADSAIGAAESSQKWRAWNG